MTQPIDISLVIPAYNETPNLRPLVEQCEEALRPFEGRHEILVIEDGSTDDTGTLLSALEEEFPRLRSIRHERGRNIGCHPSELEGFGAVKGEVALFLPADLQILPSTLPRFVEASAAADIVASRRVSRADSAWRRSLSWANNCVERAVMGVDVRDAHSSMLVNRRVIDEIVPLVESRSALIPAELLVRAGRRGFRIVEIEVDHHPRVAGRQTGATVGEIVGVQVDLVRLRWRLANDRREGTLARSSDAPTPRG